jgi:formylglycine-generating enzyme required for sulfatase activity
MVRAAALTGLALVLIGRIDEILRGFSRRDATLSSVFGSLSKAPGQRLCILVDQFEELFRFEKETSREEAELFVDLLVRNDRGGTKEGDESRDGQPATVHIVVTMRSEFLGECARFRGLADAINRTQYLVPGMDRDSLIRAIRRPALIYGGEVTLELADKLITEAAGRDDELPLIQHGLMYLWNRSAARTKANEKIVLDSAPLEAAGGLANLLSSHADAVVDEAAPDAERSDAVQRLFRALTDLNVEGRAIRRPQAFRELIAVTGAEPDKLRKIIDALRRDDVSFLTPYSQQPISDSTPIDISHEALIRCWNRLADPQDGWLKREFDDGLIWRSLLVQAKDFETNKRRILSPATTDDRWKWWRERHVNAAWAARYGGNFQLVEKLIDASRSNARRTRQLQYGYIAVSLLIGCAGAAYWIWNNQVRLEMLADIYLRGMVLSAQQERTLKPQEQFQECTRCPVMVVVPAAANFEIGEGSSKHSVTIARPFAVAKFEVTFEQWDTCFELGGCRKRPDDNDWGRGNQPVIYVSWNDADEYVTWLSKQTGKDYRLLSEAEWEYAARAGSTTAYWWGDEIKKDGQPMANCNGCGGEWANKRTAPVGSFPVSPFGLYDMHGNVWELVQDCYHENYNESLENGSAWTTGDCNYRAVRGGSWSDNPENLRSAARFSVSIFHRVNDMGFRVGRTLLSP